MKGEFSSGRNSRVVGGASGGVGARHSRDSDVLYNLCHLVASRHRADGTGVSRIYVHDEVRICSNLHRGPGQCSGTLLQ